MKFRPVFLSAVLFSLSACGGSGGGIGQIARPPAFDYADGAELRSGMHELAFEIQQLDLALATQEGNGNSMQQEVLGYLNEIQRIGNNLRRGDVSTTHRFLRDDLDMFLSDVDRARRGVQNNPPQYTMANRVLGGCVNCHRNSN